MRFPTADAAALAYLELLERAGSPRSARLTLTAGRSFAARCRACGGPDRILARGGVSRCRRCGFLWPHEDVEIPLRDAGRSGVDLGARDRQLAVLTTLGLLLGRLTTWQRRVLMLYATRAYSLETLADECARRWPRRVDGWSVYRVRADLRDARQALERRLRRAGLLEASPVDVQGA